MRLLRTNLSTRVTFENNVEWFLWVWSLTEGSFGLLDNSWIYNQAAPSLFKIQEAQQKLRYFREPFRRTRSRTRRPATVEWLNPGCWPLLRTSRSLLSVVMCSTAIPCVHLKKNLVLSNLLCHLITVVKINSFWAGMISRRKRNSAIYLLSCYALLPKKLKTSYREI
jgi:hypothetical protein